MLFGLFLRGLLFGLGLLSAGEDGLQDEEHQQQSQNGNRLMMKLAAIGALRDHGASAPEVQQEVAALQQLITDCFYHCSKEVLRGLGQMYVADERFLRNIDKAGGEGTAQFVSEAIAVYCKE